MPPDRARPVGERPILSAAWTLQCPWCAWSLYVNHRGGAYGAGEEAGQRAQAHVEAAHPGKTWTEFLRESRDG